MDWDPIPKKEPKQKDKIYELEIGKKEKSHSPLLNSKRLMAILLVSVALLISAFAVRPALIGYSVYKQAENGNYSVSELGANVQDLRVQLATTKANLSLYNQVYDQVWEEVKTKSSELTTCLSERESLTFKIETVRQQWKDDVEKCEDEQNDQVIYLGDELLNKEKEIADSKEDLINLQENFDKFAKNVAKNICCKAKVDNPNLNSYEVVNNKIVCLENGENSLSC